MNLSEKAQSRIAYQYRNSPKFRAWINTIPNIAQVEIENPLLLIINLLGIGTTNEVLELSDGTELELSDGTSLELVVGPYSWQLDILGAILGQERTTDLLSDDVYYEIVLRSAIYKNTSSALIDGIVRAVEVITGVGSVELDDLQDMSFLLYFKESLGEQEKDLLTTLDIVPRPQGVRLEGFVEVQSTPYFGFTGTGTESAGTDVAGFGETDDIPSSDGGHFAEFYEVA